MIINCEDGADGQQLSGWCSKEQIQITIPVPSLTPNHKCQNKNAKHLKRQKNILIFILTLLLVKGKLSWAVNLKKTAWTFQVWFKVASMQGKTARIWLAFVGERDNSRQIRADSANEKWPENLACWHTRIYLNACAAHDSFPIRNRKHFPCFHTVIETWVKVWDNKKLSP